ncbi:MAG: hypothetical protein LBT91_01275 [Bifidobacteriaceae bacterium]|jgi:hypothetical protein|nr:hypothetical protein [Bifidobacteriaceae bacterium]
MKKLDVLNAKKLVISILVAFIALTFVLATLVGCSWQNSLNKNDISFAEGQADWKISGQEVKFSLDKNFIYDSDKSDKDTENSKGQFNTRNIYANAQIGKNLITFSAIYQDDVDRPISKVFQLKNETDMHKVFGLGSSQKILASGQFTGNNILYATWAKVEPLPKNPSVLAVNLYILTEKGHITFAFQTTNGYNFSEEFIQNFVKSIKVEV